jgi:hypothetical protein
MSKPVFDSRVQSCDSVLLILPGSGGNEVVARDPFEVLVRAVDSLDAEEQIAMHHALHHVLTTVAASGAHRQFGVCQDCAYLGGETCCSSRAPPGRPSNAYCSAFRSSRRTLVSSASIFSQRGSTARTDTMNELTTAIC